MSIHGILGEQTTDYPTQYSPDILYPIARSLGREAIGWQADKSGIGEASIDRLSIGVDWWHAFEVSWLNLQGLSQVAIARFCVPASSPNIVESKSFKLYLNSINFTEFASWQEVETLLAKDLSACVQADVQVALFALNDQHSEMLIIQPEGICIDDALANSSQKVALSAHPDAALLTQTSSVVEKEDSGEPYQFYCNLLRSNCPVTNQPDWGTLAVSITSQKQIDNAAMLRYILSYRQHNGFHEQCVEQIFADLSEVYEPSELMVRAWYTRRGGIDINPCRVSDISLLPKPSRLIRQ